MLNTYNYKDNNPSVDNNNVYEEKFANAFLQSDDDEQMLFMYAISDKVKVSLLKVLNTIGAPHYAFKLVMEWAKDTYYAGYKF